MESAIKTIHENRVCCIQGPSNSLLCVEYCSPHNLLQPEQHMSETPTEADTVIYLSVLRQHLRLRKHNVQPNIIIYAHAKIGSSDRVRAIAG